MVSNRTFGEAGKIVASIVAKPFVKVTRSEVRMATPTPHVSRSQSEIGNIGEKVLPIRCLPAWLDFRISDTKVITCPRYFAMARIVSTLSQVIEMSHRIFMSGPMVDLPSSGSTR